MRDFHLPGRSPVYSTHGMAATAMPAATLTALDVLRGGGNALDAAVAACAVLGVIEPQSTGIGGDCFCLYAPAGTGQVIALNGSGRAPAAASIDWFEAQGISAIENISAHSVTIPGCGVGVGDAAGGAWDEGAGRGARSRRSGLRRRGGRWARGWRSDWGRLEDKLRRNGAEAFLPNGAAPRAGDVFVQRKLAETLRVIGKQGSRGVL